MGRKVSETRPPLRVTKGQQSSKFGLPELEPWTGGLEAHVLATVTLKTKTAVSHAAELRLTTPVPGRTLGGPWGRVDPRPEKADTDRKTSLEDARGLSSRRDDCATFDLTAASSTRPARNPAPCSPCSQPPSYRASPPPRSCRQLRRRSRCGVGWGGERSSSHPGTPSSISAPRGQRLGRASLRRAGSLLADAGSL